MSDAIDHPPHYTFGKYEVMDVIEGWSLNFARGCVVKYVARAGRKDPTAEVQDLMKARWYLDREIQRLTGGVLQSPAQFDNSDVEDLNEYRASDSYTVRESAATDGHAAQECSADSSDCLTPVETPQGKAG